MEPLVYIYADESCLGVQFTDRPSPGGAAGLIELWRGNEWVRREYWVSEPATTNNRMALRSAIEGLRSLNRPCRVIFTSDSQYLVRGMREWVPGWIRRGWRRKDGPIENEDLWRELVDVARRHAVDWRWVRGHAGHPQNEYANWLAIRAAKTQTDSGGLVPSGFEAWLEQRRSHGSYLDFNEFAPPKETEFHPAPLPDPGDAP
ncbi:MAG TPA: RNase H family protein [Longimicrobiales bacterium]